MQVTRYTDAVAFLAGAGDFLLQHEVENSLVLGLARSVAADPTPVEHHYFASVSDARGISVVALQTLPTKINVTRTPNREALALLAARVHEDRPTLKAVIGPEPTVAEFANALAALRGGRAENRQPQRLYELRRVIQPARMPAGRLRLAVPGDAPTLEPWADDFVDHLGEKARGAKPTSPVTDPRVLVADRIAAGQLFVWDDGVPVSMAAWAGKTVHGVRINFVYTPPELRGRGLASACVAALSQRLLDEGNAYCCLYTLLSNPVSNSIYQKIGYRPVTDTGVYAIPPAH
jgi:predicted GNAT family acetyltransferase